MKRLLLLTAPFFLGSIFAIGSSTSLSSCDKGDDVLCPETAWYQDADGDGLGNPAISQSACDQPTGYVANSGDTDDTTATSADYAGTASVTQGLANTTTANVYAAGQRIAGLGSITASDNTVWTVPAAVNYTDSSFPFALDLYNPDGTQYETARAALSAFDEANIIEIDADGEFITGYIFADNYFELYVNGTPVGKDAIPFTPFNSNIVKFRVSTPYTIALHLVDWEENLGLGTEEN